MFSESKLNSCFFLKLHFFCRDNTQLCKLGSSCKICLIVIYGFALPSLKMPYFIFSKPEQWRQEGDLFSADFQTSTTMFLLEPVISVNVIKLLQKKKSQLKSKIIPLASKFNWV